MVSWLRAVLVISLALLGVQLVGAPADSVPVAQRARCTVTGTPGNDVLRGSAGRDVICGRGGNDRLVGRGGEDVLKGGAGRDRLTGGPGDDRLDGGTGRDVLDGVDGATYRDLLTCGPGRDSAAADPPDTVRGDCERVDQDHAPSALALDPASVAEGQPVGTPVGTLSVTDPDPEDTVTYDLVPGPGADDNDNVTVTGDAVATAEVLDHETQPTLSIRVRATDGTGLTVDQVLSVTVTDTQEGPVAVDDTATTPEDTELVVPTAVLLADDSDPDGDPLTVTAVGDPVHGAVSLTGTTVTFTPEGDYCGPASFDYTVDDGHGGADVGIVAVTVTCVNDAPVAVDDSVSTDEDTPVSVPAASLLGNDIDADGDALTVTAVGGAVHGGVSLFGGSVIFDPALDYCGPASFDYTVSDGTATDVGTVRVAVTCINGAPVAVDDVFTAADGAVGNTALVVDAPGDGAPAQAGPKKTVSGNILGNDADADGPEALAVLPGTVATHDGGFVRIQSDGDFVFHPKASTSCTDSSDYFDYTVTDGRDDDTGRVTIDLSGCVWYADNAAPGNAGTSIAPFDTLALAEAASAPGDSIFVFRGDGTTAGYAAGITLKAGQQLVGEVAELEVGGAVLWPGTPGARPVLTASNADVVTLASGDTVRGLRVDPEGFGAGISGGAGVAGGTIADVRVIDSGPPTYSPGLQLVETTGAFAVSDLVIDCTGVAGTGGGIFLFSAGTVTFADAGSISVATNGLGLDAYNTTFGAGSVFDDITVTASTNGAVLLNSTSGSPTFSTLDLTTSGNPALSVLNSGAVTVAGGELHANGNRAVWLSNSPGADLTLDTVSSTNSAYEGVSLAGLGSGSFAAASGTITGAAGTAFKVTGGSGTVSYAGTIEDGPGDTASVSGRTGGTVTLSGSLTDGSDAGGGVGIISNLGGSTVLSGATKTFDTGGSNALNLSVNTGHTVSVTGGGLVLKTTTGSALAMTGGGTLNVTGAGNVVSAAGGGGGVLIDNSTIGASGVTFRSVSTTGASNGIRLSNTGSSGSFAVTGAGGTCAEDDVTGCSGGIISAGTGADSSTTTPVGTGIVLYNTKDPSFTRMWLHDFSNYAVRGTLVTGFTLDHSVVNGSNGDNGASPYLDSSLRFDTLTGTATISDTYVSGGYENNLRVLNSSGSLDRITLTDDTFGVSGDRPHWDSVYLGTAFGGGALMATVTGSTFSSAARDLFRFEHTGTGDGDLVLDGNTFANQHPAILASSGGVTLTQSGSANGDTTMQVEDNAFTGARGNAVRIFDSGPADQDGRFVNNTIGDPGTTDSGSTEGSGMYVAVLDEGTSTWSIENNVVQRYNNVGIWIQAGGAGDPHTGHLDTTVTGNTVRQPGAAAVPKNGLLVSAGAATDDAFVVCAAMSGNALAGTSTGGTDFRLRQLQSTTIRLPGYAGGPTDANAVVTFVRSANSAGSPTGSAVATSPPGGGFLGGPSCPLPDLGPVAGP